MIHSIKAKFFQSWEDLDFQFNNGTTLLLGWNYDDQTGEGSGKSSIFNAITWCLFGKLPKDTSIDGVCTIGQDNQTLVTVYLDNGTEITRTRNKNDLYISFEDKEPIRGKDMKDTQKMINELIGMSFETFCQSIYFPQNYEKKFITANEEEKAKILSEIQDLTIFDRASKKAAENSKIKQEELEKHTLSLIAVEREHSLLKTQLETFEQLNNNFNRQKEADATECKKRIDSISTNIQSLQKTMTELGAIGDVKDKNSEQTKLHKDLQKISNELYAIELMKKQSTAKDCPICKRPMEGINHAEIPDNSHLLLSRDSITEELIGLNKEIESIHDKKMKFNQYLSGIGMLQNEQKRLSRDLDKIQNAANDCEDKIYSVLEQLNAAVGQISDLKTKKDLISKDIEIFTFLKSGFKEIKSHVFQSLLNDLNIKSNFYIREFFEIPCSIRFTNVSEEGELSKIQTKVTLNNNEYTLGLLSGGQFRRVQLAVDFAISEIIAARSNKKINLRILDEPFKDLSSEKSSKILEFLKKMPGKTVIIEHSDIVKSYVDHEIRIELKNGISRLTSDDNKSTMNIHEEIASQSRN